MTKNRPESLKTLSDKASDWLKKNDPRRKKRRRANPKIAPYGGRYPREIVAGKKLCTMKEFVHEHRYTKDSDCKCIPVVAKGTTARVVFCGKNIPASRYACLLAHGAPKSEGMFALHACGNGHLNCVNPNHLRWGSPSDNMSDAVKHRQTINGHHLEKIQAID